MRRLEKRIFTLNDEIAAMRRDERLAAEELIFHQHLHDDAFRDAVASDHPMDRADARETGADVARFERHLEELARQRAKLEAERDRLLARLDRQL
ncbi:MAG: hypothetical protein ACR2JP_05615 [Acidimicrobiia bacterium]